MAKEIRAPKYPYLKIVGVPIIGKPTPHVRFSDLRRQLGQWRYALARRMAFVPHGRYGPHPDDIEDRLASIARECENTWHVAREALKGVKSHEQG